jgi:DNA-binding Lrp family transcriptional regulator
LELDDVDWKIIHMLQKDARTTYRELGNAIGYTGLGAKKRVSRLVDQNLIHTSALVNVDQLDIRLALIMLEVETPEAMQKILNRYQECPRVLNFFTSLGGYNLIALVMAENQGTLESESMEECALRSGEGIRRSEFYPIRSIPYSPFLHLKQYTQSQKDKAPCTADCQKCSSFKNGHCIGCPTVSYYKGPLRATTKSEK